MTAPLPTKVGVVGGGRMGTGIAHAFLMAGCGVEIAEADPWLADRARDAVLAAIDVSVARGTLQHAAEPVSRFTVTDGISELSDCELVIEAVPESTAIKTDLLGQLEMFLRPETVVASNTSSLSISELAAIFSAPDRFIGMHFFNPVPASKLVEIVVGSQTSPHLVSTAKGWVAALGKTAVTVQDSPGFASSRLGVLLGLEAIRMLEQGVASAEDIDAAMTLGYGHPMGPLRLTDVVGLDVRLGIAEYLAGKLGDRFAPPELLREMVSRGDLGRKTGRGFFDWETR